MKAHGLALLSRVPGGNRAYHTLQAWLGTNRIQVDEHLSRALEIVTLAREAGRDPCGGVWLEVGTGWRPFVPFVLYLIGAEQIITFDVNPWLNHRYAQETYLALRDRLRVIAARAGVDLALVQGRYDAALPHANSLRALLEATRIQYRYPSDAGNTGLPGNSIDIVTSSNVLEHVRPQVLQSIHRESMRILKPDGLVVHRFNPGDHYAGVDRSITSVNCLQYDSRQWHWYGGSGLAYHNRLRCVQHQQLLVQAGFDVRLSGIHVDPRALEALQTHRVRVHQDFQQFTQEELAADYMWFVGGRPLASTAARDRAPEIVRWGWLDGARPEAVANELQRR
jgi:hypothetical protein